MFNLFGCEIVTSFMVQMGIFFGIVLLVAIKRKTAIWNIELSAPALCLVIVWSNIIANRMATRICN